MGKVSELLRSLIEKQVNGRGIVVWYDPEGVYRGFAHTLSLPETQKVLWKDSFFRLRNEVEHALEFIDEQNRPAPGGEVPPKALIYVPMAGEDTQHALVELETAGTVMEPGANPWQRNTRLRVLAEHVFKKIAPDQVAHVCKQVEEGYLTLEELDDLSVEIEGIKSATIKLVFGTASINDVALGFAASAEYDQSLEAKQALPELEALLKTGLGFEASDLSTARDLRVAFRRFLLMGELVCSDGKGGDLDKFSSLQLPQDAEHIERVREICLAWRRRTDLRETYLEASRNVAQEMELAACAFPLEAIAGLDTFSILEQKLIEAAEQILLNGDPEKALDLAHKRKASFWSDQEPDYRIRWVLIENGARLLILGKSIRERAKKLKEDPGLFVRAYTDGEEPWYVIDKLYRHLERQYSHFDLELGEGHASFEKLMVLFRQHYTETVEIMAVRFVRALEKADFQLAGCLAQDQVYREKIYPLVSGGKKTAYFLVDALRYELGQELVDGLKDEFDISLIPGAAQLPTITSVGMAALMPGAENGIELVETAGGKLAVGVGSSTLRDRASRIKHFQGSTDLDVLVLKLKDLIKPSPKRQQAVKAAGFVLVTSQEIDQYGEEIDDESEARIIMDEVLDKLRKAIRRLAAIGIEAFVVAADHGHLFGENVEGGMSRMR